MCIFDTAGHKLVQYLFNLFSLTRAIRFIVQRVTSTLTVSELCCCLRRAVGTANSAVKLLEKMEFVLNVTCMLVILSVSGNKKLGRQCS